MSNNLERHWTQLLGQFFTVLLNCKLVGAQSNCFIAVAIRFLQYAYRIEEERQKREKKNVQKYTFIVEITQWKDFITRFKLNARANIFFAKILVFFNAVSILSTHSSKHFRSIWEIQKMVENFSLPEMSKAEYLKF